jgi:mono/diheme cytochrome c family protein
MMQRSHSTRWRWPAVASLPILLLTSAGASAQAPDASRGQALYENHCVVCHTGQVHARVNRIAATRTEIRDIVEKWQAQQKLLWNAQDVEDVVEFLNRTRYRFPEP